MSVPVLNVKESLLQIRASGRPIIGCLPLYPPLELLDAMGVTPVVLWGLADEVPYTPESDRHLEIFTCSVARRLTEFVLSDAGRLLDGLFFYNACDTLRNLADILMDQTASAGRTIPFFHLHVPMTPAGQSDSAGYLKNEISILVAQLAAELKVAFDPDRFEQSVANCSRMRMLCSQLERKTAAGCLPFSEFARLVVTGSFLPVIDQIQSLESTLAECNEGGLPDPDASTAPAVIVSGILPPPAYLSESIEQAGLRVVGNDIAAMHRSYAGQPPSHPDPGIYYEAFYRNHFPCPTLLYSGDHRLLSLMDLVRDRKADGVIFVGEKFCEYEYFEFPWIEKQLRSAGIETLAIEIAADDAQAGGHRTRIEAFAEMLKR